MAAESKTPFVRYQYARWYTEPRAREFVRETESFLIAANGSRVKKSSRHDSWYESREQVEAMVAARLQREADATFARLVGEHAKEIVEVLEFMVSNIGQPDSLETHDGFNKARALLQQIRGEA